MRNRIKIDSDTRANGIFSGTGRLHLCRLRGCPWIVLSVFSKKERRGALLSSSDLPHNRKGPVVDPCRRNRAAKGRAYTLFVERFYFNCLFKGWRGKPVLPYNQVTTECISQRLKNTGLQSIH